MTNINDYPVTCDFCGKQRAFSDIKQVSLRIEKNSKHQNLLATMCSECNKSGVKKTVHGQNVKENYKFKDEKSIFDEPEETL